MDKVQSKPDTIRNICILAHVDHGKTTLADSLVATNGYISKRIAGSARYLDDREDEQVRGITMKSSAISLTYKTENAGNMVINLIDTPGHIDFSTEVTAAIRISDGALILVDLVEGVCVQTREALKQAFEERVKMILIINKFDKAIVELQKSVDEIFQTICRIIEDCNAYISELCTYEIEFPVEEEDYFFKPETGNVIFASAIDGWGCILKHIATLFLSTFTSETLQSLTEKLWNFDYYVSKGNIISGAIEKGKPNLFSTLVLSTIHYVYFTLRIRMDHSKSSMIGTRLGIKHNTAEMKHTDPKIQTRAILQTWQPLASTILEQVKDIIPSPLVVLKSKFTHLINSYQNAELNDYANELIEKVSNNPQSQENTIAYVSKMFAVSKQILMHKAVNIVVGKRNGQQVEKSTNIQLETTEKNTLYEVDETDTDNFVVLALARIFSGVIKTGQKMYVLSPKYKPPSKSVDQEDFIANNSEIQEVVVTQLYILFGREFTAVDSVSVGNICGIHGLADHIARNGTLSNNIWCLPFVERTLMEPIVRNSIDCVNTKDLPLLTKGLKFLKQIDTGVQVTMQDTGELVLVTAGDVHLAKCLEDVRNLIGAIELNVSAPMVSLKETIMAPTKKIDINNSVVCNINEVNMEVAVTAIPLPEEIAHSILSNFDMLVLLEEFEHKSGINLLMHFDEGSNLPQPVEKVLNNELLVPRLKGLLKSAFENCEGPWSNLWSNIWSVGKKRDSINILINNTGDYTRNIFRTLDETDSRSCLDHCIVNAFNMCCHAGPMCEEPITNCAFIVNSYKLKNYECLKEQKIQILSNIPLVLRDLFRDSVKKQIPRLMEPIFTTDIQVNTKILGKVYSVVNRRHGKVLDAVGMNDSEKVLLVKAQIPVAESYDFANEIRKTTSGQANPNLRFSHYEIIDGDPYFDTDDSEEEDEESDNRNAKRASKYRREVRRRKGLKVDDEVVQHAEKQRTLNRKK